MNHLPHILTGFCLLVQSFCLLRQAWFFGSFYHEMRAALRQQRDLVAELENLVAGLEAMTPADLAESGRRSSVCISQTQQEDQANLDSKECRQEQKKTPCFSEKSPMKGEFQNENPRHRDTDETVQES